MNAQRTPPPTTSPAASRDERLAAALEAYAAAADAGDPPSRAALLEQYADVADELKSCLESLDFIRQTAPQLADALEPAGDRHALNAPATLGDFRLIREIGRGGMGVVYEAEQLSLGRRMALKVLPFAAMLDQQQLKRFKNEARAAAALDHPNIVAVHSVGEERGVHYYAMQLIEGMSLAEVIERLRNADGGMRNGDPDALRPATPTFSRDAKVRRSGARPADRLRNASGGRGQESGDGRQETVNGDQLRAAADESAIEHPSPPPALSPDTDPVAALSTLPDRNSREYFRTIARLGVQAAEALDHAHQNGILHRDVKPANLLVECSHLAPKCSHHAPRDEKPHHAERDDYTLKLWITDFGLARLESDADLTATGALLGTLRYMSPEQALGKRGVVDQRSDVYSLGATLYELLALVPPFDGNDRHDLLRRIAAEEPRSLKKVNPSIPGDLETIILKAMRKEPIDRYAAASDLADDLRRFLDSRPITARRSTLLDRARRWTRRHAALAAMGAAALAAVSLCAVVAALLVGRQARRAEENLGMALDVLDQTLAAAVAGDLTVGFESPEPERLELQRRGIKFFEEFGRQNGVDPKSWPTYRLLVSNEQLDAASGSFDKGDFAAASAALQRAIAEAEQLVAQSPGEPRHRLQLANCLENYAAALTRANRLEEATPALDRARALKESLIKGFPEENSYRYALALNHYNRSTIELQLARYDAAERELAAALPLLEIAVRDAPQERRYRHVAAMCHYNLGIVLQATNRAPEAEEVWEQNLDEWRSLAQEFPRISEFRSRSAATLSNLAVFARDRGDFAACRALAEEALALQKQALEIKPPFEQSAEFLRSHYKILSQALWRLHDETALAAISEERIMLLPDVPWEYFAAAGSLGLCAEMLQGDAIIAAGADRERLTDERCRRAMEILAEAQSRFEFDEAQVLLADGYLSVGDSLAKADRRDGAEQAWRAAREMFVDFSNRSAPLAPEEIAQRLKSAEERLQTSSTADVAHGRAREERHE